VNSYLKTHRSFFVPFLIIWIWGVLFWLNHEKGFLLHWFADNRTETLNIILPIWTLLGEAWIFVVLFIGLLFKKVSHALAIAVGGILSLGFSSSLKGIFEVPRPRLWLLRQGELNSFHSVLDHPIRDGYSSFPSGHAMGAFVLASILSLMYPKYRLLFLFLAIGVALSRVYLGHHFLEDVLMGSIIGVLIGSTTAIISASLQGKWQKNIRELLRSWSRY
jgi:membrane-associated phospholipid phosphatase